MRIRTNSLEKKKNAGGSSIARPPNCHDFTRDRARAKGGTTKLPKKDPLSVSENIAESTWGRV